MLLTNYLFANPIYICIYFEECIFKQHVIIQASFVKDDGTLFIIFNFIFPSMIERACVEDMTQFIYHLDPDTKK